MGILTADMKRVVGEQRLGFVATVCPDGMPGAPRLSGMAMTSSLPTSDRRHAREPANVLDPFVRRGYRFIVVASILESGAPYDKVLAYDWGRRARSVIREIVMIRVQTAQPIDSPAHDLGLTEDQIRDWGAALPVTSS